MATVLIYAIFSVFGAMIPGYILGRKGILTDQFLKGVSQFIMRFAYPFLTFVSVTQSFTFNEVVSNYHLPLMMILVLLIAFTGIMILLIFFKVNQPKTKSALTFVATFNNYIFLPYAVIQYAMGDKLAATVVIASLGAELTVWTLGVFVLQGKAEFHLKTFLGHLVSPPLMGLYLGVFTLFVLDYFNTSIAVLKHQFGAIEAVWKSMDLVAQATVPLTLTLAGANIAKVKMASLKSLKVWGVISYRLIIAPMFILLVLHFFFPNYIYKEVFYIVAIMPIAFNSLVLGELFDADMDLIGGAILVAYSISLITMPLWLLILF